MVYADYLPRITPSQGPEIELEHTIHMVQISDQQLEKIRLATDNDAELSTLWQQSVQGCSKDGQKLLAYERLPVG